MELQSDSSVELDLKNAFDNQTIPGEYKFRVRLKYDDKTKDLTRDITVTAAQIIETIPEKKTHVEAEINESGGELEEDVPESPATGMVTARETDFVSSLSNIYNSFIGWLLSIFKF